MRKLRAVDLFCGAGGTSSGAIASGMVDVALAVNHWRVAVKSHLHNHPNTRHVCAEIDMVDPRDFMDMKLDMILASPECIFHSNARGGKPVDDQRRATAWCVPRWAEVLRPKYIVIENVREFKDWGPLTEKRDKQNRIVKERGETCWVPDKKRKGEIFQAWIAALKGIGYQVEWKLINSADVGAATKRTRLFVMCRMGSSKQPMPWPKSTHTPDKYMPAASIIDWSLPAPSIFKRKKRLSEKTLRRIEIGLRKFNSGTPKPYLIDRNWQENRGGRNRVHDITQPLGTVTTHGGQGLVQPIVVNLHGKSDAQSIDDPLATVTGTRNLGLAQPFLTPNFGERDTQEPRTHSVDEPLPVVTGRGAGNLIQPFLIPRQGHFDCQKDKPAASIDQPLNTITASHSPAALVQPFLVKAAGSGYNDPTFAGVTSADQPMPTIVGQPHHALVEPFVMDLAHGSDDAARASSIDQPVPTITSKHTQTLVQPYLVGYHGGTDPNRDGTERQTSVDAPLPTVDTNPRYALATPFQYQMIGRGAGRSASIDDPVPTIIATRDTHGLVQPFIAHIAGPGSSRVDESNLTSTEEPLRTILTREDRALVTPYMVDANHGDEGRRGDGVQSVDDPLGTVTAVRGKAIAQPFVAQCNGTGTANSIEEPLTTIAGHNRHGLVVPATAAAWYHGHMAALRAEYHDSPAMQNLLNTMEELGIVDVGYRMLVNDELKLAQGFPKDYLIFGTSSEVTKQIGNSVHTYVAEAICGAIGLAEQPKPRKTKADQEPRRESA